MLQDSQRASFTSPPPARFRTASRTEAGKPVTLRGFGAGR